MVAASGIDLSETRRGGAVWELINACGGFSVLDLNSMLEGLNVYSFS